MMKYSFLKLTSLFVASAASVFADEVAPKTKPNVIVIFADDLGYGDVGCFGAIKVQTPNIDKLAAEGKRFTDAHAAATVCSPSRYGLLTGRSPWRLNKQGNGYRLEDERMTLAELFKSEGYVSAAIGKWHLGYGKDWNNPPIKGPLNHGFDYHFGVPQNHNDGTRCYMENDDIYGRKEGEDFKMVKGKAFPEGIAEFRVDDQVDTMLTSKAVEFIKRSAERPFFLYFNPVATHTHITPAAQFRGTSQAGLLGDYVHELDFHVGEIMGALDELKIADKTLVIFTSDNGGTYKDFRGTDGVVLNLASEEGGVLEGFKTAKADALKLGHLCNGVYRGRKGYPEEGGHRVAFIARWPGKIPAGTTSDYTFMHTDMMSTVAEMLGVKLPDDAGEDSVSILPRLLEKQDAPRMERTIYVQGDTKNDAIAICTGRWKMISGKGDDKVPAVQLYDLHADPAETKNLAKENPELVEQMLDGLNKARVAGRTRL
ncbi:MAG: sulfatase family protein [Akkermansiaceae bacterium]